METPKQLTPLMQQYVDIKKEYKDALLLFQVGDFFELFYEDAKTAASFLAITLTSRNKQDPNSIPLCGVPIHALDYYLNKLIKGGFHVAICEQLEDPVPGKVVKRGVTRVHTPGMLVEAQMLEEKTPSFLSACVESNGVYGLAFFELLTGQLYLTKVDDMLSLENEMMRFCPDEVVLSEKENGAFINVCTRMGFASSLHSFVEGQDYMPIIHGMLSLSDKATCYEYVAITQVVNLLCSYIKKNQPKALNAIYQVQCYDPAYYLALDVATQKNLELISNNQDQTTKHSLFHVLDKAVTAMGSRCLRKWLVRPLYDQVLIEQRQDLIEHVVQAVHIHKDVQALLRVINDVERVIGRFILDRASGLDFIHLRRVFLSLRNSPVLQVKELVQLKLIQSIMKKVEQAHDLIDLFERALDDENVQESLIRVGYHKKLDELRALVDQRSQALLNFEISEQRRTHIASLKVKYTQMHGYYIEMPKSQSAQAPTDYVSMQSLANRERYTCVKLKQLEQEINAAQQQSEVLEAEILDYLKQAVHAKKQLLRSLAIDLATFDALYGLAIVAYQEGYTRPHFNQKRIVELNGARHPVLNKIDTSTVIENNVLLDEQHSTIIITGPNMGGKSTYLRLIALQAIMAQIGSFVSSRQATLPLFDRIFTRIGAGDNLAGGKSTFLMEMDETAVICAKATQNSLIILDEVGRGTSTYDGLAIAQAVVEYISEHIKARCLFATHYHELTALEQEHAHIKNLYASCKQINGELVFLYKIIPGIAHQSYGIEVARKAGLPEKIIDRAFILQEQFSSNKNQSAGCKSTTAAKCLQRELAAARAQLSQISKRCEHLESLNLNNLTPKQALDILWSWQEQN